MVIENDVPHAVVDTATILENTSITYNVITNGDGTSDIPGADGPITLIDATVASPAMGTVTHLANGDVHFTAAANFAGDAVINYTIQDADGDTSSATLTVHVTDTNNQAPVITSGDTFEVQENSTAVTTVVATDADTTGEAITYSITGGADNSLFNINENTGELSFASPPDFETQPHTYHVEVTASDGVNPSTPQLITVNLTDQNEFAVSTPVDSDAAINAVDENVAVGTVVGVTAFASDDDATTNGVTYSLTAMMPVACSPSIRYRCGDHGGGD